VRGDAAGGRAKGQIRLAELRPGAGWVLGGGEVGEAEGEGGGPSIIASAGITVLLQAQGGGVIRLAPRRRLRSSWCD